MIGLPPLLVGSLQLTSAWRVAAPAVTFPGAEGVPGVVGVIALEAAETAPGPVPLSAWTVKV